jgi:phosphatidylglycerol:prolipoprotein diacylglycerol transferase
MLAVAFWVAIELSARLARRRGMDGERIVDLGIVVLISSVAGSRLVFVLTHLGDYVQSPLDVFKVWEGGLTFYGGLAAGVLFGILYLRAKRLPILAVSDVVAPQIALGIALARIGCLLNGCCFGKQSDLPWACTFPTDSQAGWTMAGMTIHPTQVYSAIANVMIFIALRRLLRRGGPAGMVFYAFVLSYGAWRFVIDFVRYYENHMYVTLAGVGFTWNQVLSIAVAGVGGLLLLSLIAHDKSVRA